MHKFLDKNHDQVRQDVLDLFVRSRTRVSLASHRSGPAPTHGPTTTPSPPLGLRRVATSWLRLALAKDKGGLDTLSLACSRLAWLLILILPSGS